MTTRSFISWFFLLVALISLVACQPAAKAPLAPALPYLEANTALPFPTLFPSSTVSPTPTHIPSPTTTLSPQPSQSPTLFAVGPIAFPPGTNPLTGLPVKDPTRLDRRPVFVQVSNFPRESRPQSGLSAADLVFDYYIGEGDNRFLAVYYGQDATKVGPVRSARRVNAQLVPLYQGILAYALADPNAVFPVIDRYLGARAISAGSSTCPALCDDGPHNVFSVFADTANLTRFAAKQMKVTQQRPDLDGMAFDSRLIQSGLDGRQILYAFSTFNQAIWRYEPTTRQYYRWSESVGADNTVSMLPLNDRATGQQIAFDNIVILFAPYEQFAPTLHDITIWYNQYGRRAVLFRDGRMVEARWFTPGTNRPIVFTTPDGTSSLAFKPGRTWIVLAGTTSPLQEAAPGQWEMRFSIP